MAEDFDLFESGDASAPSGQEVTQEAYERFRDQYKKTQAAIKKIKKEEGKKKKQDNALAHIIVQFLSDERFTQFFLLISRIVAKNVPSDIILAVLSLIHQESAKAIEEKKLTLPKEDFTKGQTSSFPPEIKAHISRWTQNIAAVMTAEPHKALETLVNHQSWEMDTHLPELAAAVLQQFFVFKKMDVPPIDNLRGFTNGFFEKILQNLESQVHEQGALAGEVDKDFEKEKGAEAS